MWTEFYLDQNTSKSNAQLRNKIILVSASECSGSSGNAIYCIYNTSSSQSTRTCSIANSNYICYKHTDLHTLTIVNTCK